MYLRIMLSAVSLASGICLIAQGNEFGYNTPEGALRHDMLILDDDVRNSALAGYKRRFNMSDDELSSRLVKLATIATNSEETTLRMFTVAAIGDFGTTNALDFLENEALRGGNISGGVEGFGRITKFDDSFFALAEKMLSDKSRPNRYRRSAVYNVYRELLTSDKPFWIPVSQVVREKAEQSLLQAALDEYSFPVTVDEILIRGVDNYKDYPQRLQIARRIVQSTDASDYVHNYFKNVIEQMGHAETVAKKISPDMAGAKNGEGRNGTNIAVRILGKNVEGAEGNLSVAKDADVPSTHRWFYMVIGGMLLLALAVLAFVALFSTRRAPLSRKDHG